MNSLQFQDKIGKLEHRISVLEYKREYEQRQALIREQEIRREYESLLMAKETELLSSRNQINHLLRIIEQMTTVKMKDASTLESKGSSTERKNSDDNRIVIELENKEIRQSICDIQENLEITDEGNSSIFPPKSHRKQAVTEIVIPNYSLKFSSQDLNKIETSLNKYNDFSCDSDSKQSCYVLPSPTCSNTSEGVIGLYINELKRNVVKGKENSISDEETLSPFNIKLPETEIISNTIQYLNFAKNRRNTDCVLSSHIKDSNFCRTEPNTNLNREAPLNTDQNPSCKILREKLESLRTPSSRVFK